MHMTAIQTITWGDPQHDRFPEIFAKTKACGFDALEIGFRRLSKWEPAAMVDLLAQHDLKISASHVGGNLEDPQQAIAEGLDVGKAVGHLKQLGCDCLMQSGLRGLSGDALDSAIDVLNDSAKCAADQGITLLYHNHDWEFENNANIFKRLRERACPELGFGPDLGWAYRAGVNLTELLADIGPQVKVLHFKDFGRNTRNEAQADTVHLGTGTVDFSPAFTWLRSNPHQTCWLTVEQDRAPDADVAAQENGSWLQQQLLRTGAA